MAAAHHVALVSGMAKIRTDHSSSSTQVREDSLGNEVGPGVNIHKLAELAGHRRDN